MVSRECLERIANSLGSEVKTNPRGVVSFTGKDAQDKLVIVRGEQVTSIMDTLDVTIVTPGTDKRDSVLLVSGKEEEDLEEDLEGGTRIVDVKDDSFVVNSKRAGIIIHHKNNC